MGFLELWRQCGVSHEMRWGAQGASPAAPGKSGPHAHGEGELVITFELWCWRRLLRVPWAARRSNQSILEEISPGISLEGKMLKLKLQYSCLENPMDGEVWWAAVHGIAKSRT